LEGSLPMDEATWRLCCLARESLIADSSEKLNDTEVYELYLKERGKLLGIDGGVPSGKALIRIAGMGRLYGLEDGKRLMSVWKDLHADTQKTLETELNYNGIEEKAILAALFPAVLSNAQNTVKRMERSKALKEGKGDGEKASNVENMLNEAMQAALLILEEVFKQSRTEIKEHNGVYISDFSAVARRWGSEDPRRDVELLKNGLLSIEMMKNPIDGHGVDFKLTELQVAKAEQQKLIIEQQKKITDYQKERSEQQKLVTEQQKIITYLHKIIADQQKMLDDDQITFEKQKGIIENQLKIITDHQTAKTEQQKSMSEQQQKEIVEHYQKVTNDQQKPPNN